MKRILQYTLLLLTGVVFSQQETLLTQYRQQMALFNPAAVSLEAGSSLTLLHRRQWVDVPSSPVTTSFTYGFNAGKNVGLGISIVSDKVFVEQSTFVSVDYSYRLQLGEVSYLYFGVKAGGNFYALNTNALQTYNPASDASLSSVSFFMPNIGFGAYYKSGDFYLSLGVPRLLNTTYTKSNNGTAVSATDRPHLYTGVGYRFLVDQSSQLEFTPSLFSRVTTGAPSSLDANVMVGFYDRFDIGATYRTDNTYAGIFQMDVTTTLMMGWVYEMSKSELSNIGNSFELLLRYQF